MLRDTSIQKPSRLLLARITTGPTSRRCSNRRITRFNLLRTVTGKRRSTALEAQEALPPQGSTVGLFGDEQEVFEWSRRSGRRARRRTAWTTRPDHHQLPRTQGASHLAVSTAASCQP